MSYSNGKLPEETISHGKVIEIVKGLPGVGFKLTDNGDYDMQNKKLRNVGSPQTNDDATTKSYVDSEVNKTLKLDGSNAMTGALNMDNRRVENIAPARHGYSDAVSSLHLHNYYMDLNTEDGKIEIQFPFDMKDQKISNLAEGTDNSDAITKHQLETGLAPKADKTELASYLKRDGSISVTSDFDFGDNKITKVGNGTQSTDVVNKGYVDTELFAKPNVNQVVLRDGSQYVTGNLNMSQNKITNLKKASSGTDAVNWSQMLEEQRKYLHLTGGTMQGDINFNQNSIYNIKNVSNDTSAVNKAYVDQKVSQAGGSVDLTPYLKRDGTVSVTGKFDFGDNIITRIGNGTQSTDVVNKGYIDTELFAKPNVNQVVLLDGSQDMAGNLNMSLNKIIDCGQPTGTRDVTNKAYVDSEVGKKPDINQVILRDGSNTMTSNLDMNNQQIKNVKDATHNQDAITLKQVNDAIATTSTNNNKYTDQKISESHISTHTNRKNVLAYAMDDGEFTEDAGIQDANLIDFNDMPHKTNKKAFSMKVQRTNDGSSEYKGRFDFNLFKLIRDNFSDHYTVCLETYFQKSPFYDYEFGSTVLSFEALNINIDTGLTIKVNSEYKYLRTILNLSPDGTSKQIQRRLYVNFKSNFDNSSPVLLPIFVLIYGIKDEAKSDLDMTIYDYEKAYEVSNNNLQLHIPINMNNNGIKGLPRSPIDDNSPLTRTYMRLVSFPCILVGTTEIGTRTFHFAYEMKLDGTTTNIRLSSVLGRQSMHILRVVIWTNKPLNGTYKLIINNNILQISASGVNGLVFNLNAAYHGFSRIFIKSSDSERKRVFYTIHYRPYNF